MDTEHLLIKGKLDSDPCYQGELRVSQRWRDLSAAGLAKNRALDEKLCSLGPLVRNARPIAEWMIVESGGRGSTACGRASSGSVVSAGKRLAALALPGLAARPGPVPPAPQPAALPKFGSCSGCRRNNDGLCRHRDGPTGGRRWG